jgi:hypothetical protein
VRIRTACSSGRTKILPVADLAGAGALAERVDGGVDEVVGDRDLKAHLLGEAHLHGGAAVGLDPVELTAVALDAADRESPHLGFVKGLQHLVSLLGPDDADHEFHAPLLSPDLPKRADSTSQLAASLSARQAGLRGRQNPPGRPLPLSTIAGDGHSYPQAASQAASFPLA